MGGRGNALIVGCVHWLFAQGADHECETVNVSFV